MKNLKSILGGAALFLISGAVLAAGNLKVNIAPNGTDRAAVEISNVAESIYEIELKNERGEIVFYKRTNAPSISYSQNYNFSILEEGTYYLTVKVNNEKIENTLGISKGQVAVMNQRKEVKPFFTVKENRLELSYLNFELENLKVLVYDNNRLIFEKELKPEFAVNYAVDFSQLDRGKYDAVLATDNRFFEYQITKK
jgi:hypothetical protein